MLFVCLFRPSLSLLRTLCRGIYKRPNFIFALALPAGSGGRTYIVPHVYCFFFIDPSGAHTVGKEKHITYSLFTPSPFDSERRAQPVDEFHRVILFVHMCAAEIPRDSYPRVVFLVKRERETVRGGNWHLNGYAPAFQQSSSINKDSRRRSGECKSTTRGIPHRLLYLMMNSRI